MTDRHLLTVSVILTV